MPQVPQELLLAMEPKVTELLRPCATTEAVELLSVNPEDVARIAATTENGLENLMEIRGLQVLGDREQPDHHWAHVTEGRSQNQALDR